MNAVGVGGSLDLVMLRRILSSGSTWTAFQLVLLLLTFENEIVKFAFGVLLLTFENEIEVGVTALLVNNGLMQQRTPPIEELIAIGVLPCFVELLYREDSPALQVSRDSANSEVLLLLT
jgi:hypothetical protein